MEALLKAAVESRKFGNKDLGLQELNRETKEVELVEQIEASSSHPTQFGQVSKTSDQNRTMTYDPQVDDHCLSNPWKGSIVRDVFSRRIFKELPPKSIAIVLVDEAFKSFNATFPIFDAQSFLQLLRNHYSESGSSDPGCWACINVVFALAHRFRAMRTLEAENENSAACGYMQNALAVISELTMLHNSLPAVQALLGMTIVLQGTPNPRLCSVLIAACIRLAQTMGLHRKNQDQTLTEAEIEERKNVFWIAYSIDRDISLRTGQPPAQDDDDMDVDLPTGRTLYGSQVAPLNRNGNELDTFNFFSAQIGLAIIQGQIYKKLYSVKGTHQSEVQQLVAVQELDSMLADWRSSVPMDFEDDTITSLQLPISPELLHMIILRFSYVNCLITVHRPFPWSSSPRPNSSNPPLDPALGVQNALSPESICIVEARKTIRLIQITPHGDYASAWYFTRFLPIFEFALTFRRLLIHYFFAAVTALLENVVRHPSHPQAHSDILLMDPFLQLLEILSEEGKSEEVQRMYDFCVDMNGKARDAVERVNRSMVCSHTNKSKAQGEKETVEDFIRRVECISAGCPNENINGAGESWAGGGSTMADLDGSREFDMLDG